jgi:hypothetical protein
MPQGKGKAFETGVLFHVAVNAARSIKAPPREGNQQAALTSVVFSVIALEAFLNEMTEYAADPAMNPQPPPAVAALVEFMNDAARLSLESKFILSNWILTGKRLEKGESFVQDFLLLVWLRNALVHFKPSETVNLIMSPDEIHQKLVGKFKSKNILATEIESVLTPWTQLITTKALAQWSCQTAAQMVVDFVQKVPEGALRTFLGSFQMHFTSVDYS